MDLEFYYDIGSPYSYLASTRVEAIAADCGAEVQWRPFLLGGVFKAVGNQAPALLPPRGRYMLTDLRRWADFYGIPFSMPGQFPIDTLQAMRGLTVLEDNERIDATHRLFRAYWADGRDVSDPGVLADLVGEEVVEHTSDPEVKAALREVTDTAVQRGAFGAPTLFVGDEMFFGNDRLPFVEQALRRANG